MVEAEIFTGEGKASEFLTMKPYTQFIRETEGFKPYPGTLNLRAEPEMIKEVKEEAEKHRMDSTEFDGRELGGITIYSVCLKDEKCCVVEPDLSRYGEDVMEIVAGFNIREKFGLTDGDIVEVETRIQR